MATDVATCIVSSPARSPPPVSPNQLPAPVLPPLETVIENRIFVGGIPSHANVNELRAFLAEKFHRAVIKDIKIISDKAGVSKGYGFVTFETRDMAQEILNSTDYDNIIFKDRKLNISKAVKKLSTKTEHNSSGGGVGGGGSSGSAINLGAATAFLPDGGATGAAGGAPVQYLLYRRPDSGLGQLLTALPFGYCTPIYLSGAPQALPLFSTGPAGLGGLGAAQIIASPAAQASSASSVCPTSAAASLHWPASTSSSTLPAGTQHDSNSATVQLIGATSALPCLTTTVPSGTGATAAAAIGQNGELIYYSLPALTAASNQLSANLPNPGGHSDYGTGSEPSNSLLTDAGNDSPASSDNGVGLGMGNLGIYGIIGSPVQPSFKTAFDCCGGGGVSHGYGSPHASCLLSHRNNSNSSGIIGFSPTSSQQQQQQPLTKQTQPHQSGIENCDAFFSGLYSESRFDFKFNA